MALRQLLLAMSAAALICCAQTQQAVQAQVAPQGGQTPSAAQQHAITEMTAEIARQWQQIGDMRQQLAACLQRSGQAQPDDAEGSPVAVGVTADSDGDPLIEHWRADIEAQRQIIAELQQRIEPCSAGK